jgi:hypothetical protein
MFAMFSRPYSPETTAAGWLRFLMMPMLCALLTSICTSNHHPWGARLYALLGAILLCGQAPPPATKERWLLGISFRVVGLVAALLTAIAWRHWHG